MIEQVSNTITFWAHYTGSTTLTGTTGLTVTVDVYLGSDGSSLISSGSATDVGGGLYKYALGSTATATESEYVAVFRTATTSVAQMHLPALWVVGKAGVEDLDATVSSRASATAYTTARGDNLAYLDAAITSRAAASAYTTTRGDYLDNLAAYTTTRGDYLDNLSGATPSISVVSPVALDDSVTIYRNDDYSTLDNREIKFTTTTTDQWPTLTNTSGLSLVAGSSASVLSATGNVTTATGATKEIYFELTSTQTNVNPGVYPFDVQATIASTSGGATRKVTLVSSTLKVLADLSS